MMKQEFLSKLRDGLYGLPQADVEERITFYSEMIDDRMEEGLSEEDAISEIGDVQGIVSQILMETPLKKIVKEKVRFKKEISALEIVLLVLGSPIWLSLLVAAFAVFLVLYVLMWATVVSFWAIFGSLIGCFIGGLVSSIITISCGNALSGLALLGAGIFCGGLSIVMFFACRQITLGIVFITKKIALGIKHMFLGRERTK